LTGTAIPEKMPAFLMAYCTSCGFQNSEPAQFCQSCGAVMGPDAGITSRYGGFWKRVAAAILDFVLLSVGSGILVGIANIAGGLVSLALPWIYEAYMLSSPKQATLGKMALGLIATDTKGRRLTFARATGRHFAKYLSAMILGIGFIMVAFTAKKQGLHDLLADTLVVETQPN
jgi:uncharacterized RDD family membrane protein YckC